MTSTSRFISLKQQLLIHGGGIAAVVLLAGVSWKVTSLLQAKEAGLDQQLTTVLELVSNDREIRMKHEQVSQEIQSLHNASAKHAQSDVAAPNDAEFLAQISQLANKVELSIKSYSPGQASSDGFDVQIAATASYTGVCQFFSGLSSISSLCEVTQCSIAAPQQEQGPCTLDLTIRVLNPSQLHATLASTRSEQ